MAVLRCDFFSEALGLSTSMTVILPQQPFHNREVGEKFPTLYLLHGYSDDDTIWTRRTSIERYVDGLGLAVVMPQVHHSYYTDMVHGHRFWTFLSEELPPVARSFFNLSDKREDNFVAGLSMGGYGAFKWAFRQPEKFAAAASLSGALDVVNTVEMMSQDDARRKSFEHIFGNNKVAGTENDLLWLLEQRKDSNMEMPKLYQCCGTEDFLYHQNVKFKELCEQTKLELTTSFSPGEHEWGYWDAKIQDVLKWLPIKAYDN
ncbi:alpha/beta hydrolase [Sutcliffiella sp. NC1]|uniref:alpha/beta hydrolase n=1 Tax=Sutcliffiella sp. NC1 TaxID=3004096 RepID=UPI0022DE9007|nr:alpha/beta hydrolase family protein [Sutcliffiella sp. NC1]WBL14646.1 alpha/beta hydrolase family protein [Sutcliffiella sp. NC1]